MVNSMSNINSGTFSINSISANSISTELPKDTNITQLYSGIIQHSGAMLPFDMVYNQAYLVVFDDIRYKFINDSWKIGDMEKYGFEIYRVNGVTTIYTSDDGIHNLSISKINPFMTNLANYVYDRTNNIDAISVNTDRISAKSISVEADDDTNITFWASASMDYGRDSMLMGSIDSKPLIPDQYYFIIFDGVKYKRKCVLNNYGEYSIGDRIKDGFRVFDYGDGTIGFNTSDTNGHTISIYSMETCVTDLIEYINGRKTIFIELPNKTKTTLLRSGTTNDYTSSLDGKFLTPNQTYLVVFDGIEYKFICYRDANGDLYLGRYRDMAIYGFYIKEDYGGISNIYTSDSKEHNFSISIIEPFMTNLADYINALELKISYLESKLQSWEYISALTSVDKNLLNYNFISNSLGFEAVIKEAE